MTVVITYDISQDSRRARVAALLQVWGDRIQRSVFVCTLDEAALVELVERLRAAIDPDTDAVHVLRQCLTCWNEVGVLGQAHVDDEPFYWAVL